MIWLSLLILAACQATPDPAPGAEVLAGDVVAGGVDLAIDDSGTAWISWVADDEVFVARSDGGSFTPGKSIGVGDRTPSVGTARRPRLAVDDERIAVAFSDGVTPDAEIWLYVADKTTLDFSGQLLAETGRHDTLDQPTLAFDGGEIHVAWKFGLDHDYGIAIGRESDNYTPVEVYGFPGQPCECCPHELTMVDSDVVLVQRGNELDLREIYLGFVDDAGQAEVHRVSQNDWLVAGCPYDGPSTTRTDSGRWLATWIDATLGDARAWVSASDDGGVTWGAGLVVLPDGDRSQAWPNLTSNGDDVWLTVEEIWLRTRLFHSGDGGMSFEEQTMDEDIVDTQLASGGGRAGMIGLDRDDHLVWWALGSPP